MDLYAILDLDRDATPKQIRQAYRKKVKVLHPDAGGDRAAFDRAAMAHEVLMDPERRLHYDNTGDFAGSKPDNSKVEMMEVLYQIFGGTMQSAQDQNFDPAKVDFLAGMLEMIAHIENKMAEDNADFEIKRKLMTRVLGRFEPNDDETPNHLETIILENLKQLDKKQEPLLKAIRLHRDARIYLQGMSYRKDLSIKISSYMHTGTTMSTF